LYTIAVAIIDVILAIISFIASIGTIASIFIYTINATSVHAIVYRRTLLIKAIVDIDLTFVARPSFVAFANEMFQFINARAIDASVNRYTIGFAIINVFFASGSFITRVAAITLEALDKIFTRAAVCTIMQYFIPTHAIVDVCFAVNSFVTRASAIACVIRKAVLACTILALVPITMVNILIAILSEISRAGAIAFITLHKVIAYTSVCAQVDYAIIDVILAFVSFIACSGAITSKTFDAVYARSMHAIVKKLIVFIETIVYIACAMFSSESCVAAIAFI
jgi:hypothetical protein